MSTATLVRCDVVVEPVNEEQEQLEQVFVSLGIRPFRNASVWRYKAWKAWCTTPLRTHLHLWFFRIVLGLVITSALVGFPCAAVAIVLKIYGTIPTTLLNCTYGSVASFLITGLTLTLYASRVSGRMIPYAQWVTEPFEETAAIPEFVVQTVVDVQERCPGARFFVEELHLNHITLDPLLFVIDPHGKKCYLEVWNEPGFCQKREM